MNERLRNYLRSLGLDENATDEQAWGFYNNIRGIQANIASALNYQEEDTAARTNCDVMIRALGYDPANPQQLLQSQSPADGAEPQRSAPGNDGASTAGDLENATQEGVRREAERREAIRQLAAVAGTPDEVLRALEEDTQITIEAARQRIFEDHQQRTRANVPADAPNRAPAGHSQNSVSDFNRNSLACALMMREGIHDPTQRWSLYRDETGTVQSVNRSNDDEICRAAERGHQLRRFSMVELVRQAMALDGIEVAPDSYSIGRALQQRGSAAMSTSALVGIFTQTFGAKMLNSFETTRDTTQGWTIDGENPNFLQNERHRMARGAALTKHAKSGTAEDVQIREALTEFVKIFRYSGMFVVDDIDLQNDTFGAMNKFTPEEMGEAARRIGPDLVYAILLANPTLADSVALFHGTHGNLGTAALSKSSLEAGTTAVSVQRENGVNLNLDAQFVIVPRALRYTARELVRSATVIMAGSTDEVRPSANALVDDDLQVVSDSRLDNGVTDPDSGTTYSGDTNNWFLATPGSRHTIEKTYLRGSSRSPEMRSGVLDKGQFGIWFDVHQDIGAKALAYQGLYKSAVA